MDSSDINQIFHPSDFSESSLTAFAHALKLAICAKSGLTIYHTNTDQSAASWNAFPKVRHILEQWSVLPPNSTRDDVMELGLGIEKISASHKDPVTSVLRFLEKHPQDLIVLTTYQHEGIERLIKRSIAEPIARRSGITTLFIPHSSNGFVSFKTGEVSLSRILIPVDYTPSPQLSIDLAILFADLLGCKRPHFQILHVGSELTMPRIQLPRIEGATWTPILAEGNIIDQILQTAKDHSSDLIVMATQGHDRLIDAISGSTTERVARAATCPVLSVPVDQILRGSIPEVLIYNTT